MFDAAPEEFGSSRAFIATAALAVGLLTGFAGGYVTSQRHHAGVSPDLPRTGLSDRSGEQAAAEEPAQTYTETPVADSPVEVADAPVEVAPPAVATPVVATVEVAPTRTPEVVAAAPRAPTPRPVTATRTGAIVVFSRPSGAEVFLDERLVGSTPLSLDEVAAGTHGVRIALPEHRTWATSVNVTPGSSRRVAASLER